MFSLVTKCVHCKVVSVEIANFVTLCCWHPCLIKVLLSKFDGVTKT